MLVESSMGVPENAETKKSLAYVMQGMKNGGILLIRFIKTKKDVASDSSVKNASAGSSAPPCDLMHKTPSSNRKGSSTILNKTILNTENGDKAAAAAVAAKYPAPVNATAATPAPENAPAASGWGDLFKKKPGE